jgi:hypothetical protein
MQEPPAEQEDIGKLEPTEVVGVDLHQIGNKHYMVIVDKASGFRTCYPVKDMTSSTAIEKMETYCHTYGIPVKIVHDNGPCYRTAWGTWCDEMGIDNQASSPLNPKSNGLSETGVKVVKSFQKKSGCPDRKLQEFMFRMNSVQRADGTGSPAEIFFRRRPRCGFPNIITKTEATYQRLQDMRQAMVNRRNRKMAKHYSTSQYRPGDRVRVQCQQTGEWSSSATVMEKRRDPEGKTSDSYHIKKDEGGMCLRSGRYLKIKKDHARGVIAHMCSRVKVVSCLRKRSILVKRRVSFCTVKPASVDQKVQASDKE